MLIWSQKADSHPVTLMCVSGDRIGLSLVSLSQGLRSKLIIAMLLAAVLVRTLFDVAPFGGQPVEFLPRLGFWVGYHVGMLALCSLLFALLERLSKRRGHGLGTASLIFYAIPVAVSVVAGQAVAAFLFGFSAVPGSDFLAFFLKDMVLLLLFETFMLTVVWPEYLRWQQIRHLRQRQQAAKVYEGDLQKILGQGGHDIRQGTSNQ